MNSRMIRLFISSTFYDFQKERDELITTVYPSLEAYCKKNGFSFQVVDLRWGISGKDAVNHKTLQLCLEEIRRCQKLSPKPNFLILQGSRYGWIPLPDKIPEADWNHIVQSITTKKGATFNLGLLYRWYQQNVNSLDGHYELTINCDPDTEEALKKLIFDNIDFQNALGMYNVSATEQEIITAGIFDNPEVQNHTVAVIRRIPDEYVGTSDETKHAESNEMLKKARRLQKRLLDIKNPRFQRHRIELDQEADYLRKIEEHLREIIDERIKEAKLEDASVTDHEAVDGQIVHEYIDVNNNFPQFMDTVNQNRGKVVLCQGLSGSGKSYLMRYFEAMTPTSCACIHADTLPEGNQILSVMYQLASRIEGLLGPREQSCSTLSHENLVDRFSEYLTQFEVQSPFYLIIDGTDQISDWKKVKGSLFSLKLPENMTMIILNADATTMKQDEKPAAQFKIRPINGTNASGIIMDMLRRSGMTLTPMQMEHLIPRLPKEMTMLYLHLLCNKIARDPQSYFLVNENSFVATTEELIQDRLAYQKDYLEPSFFYHILGYILVAHDGISEQDLIDLLLEDTQLTETVAKKYPNWPIPKGQNGLRTVYMVLWSRIHSELSDFFAESQRFGVCHIRFRHITIYKQVRALLLKADAGLETALLRKYADYYLKQDSAFCGEHALHHNTRKLREAFTALYTLGDFGSIAKLLEDPLYIDGYIRHGWYNEIASQLAELSNRNHVTELHRLYIKTLIQNRMLLISWPDSLLMIPAIRRITDTNYLKASDYTMSLQKIPNSIRSMAYTSSSADMPQEVGRMKAYIPAREINYALRDDHIFAVRDINQVRIFDYQKHIELGTGCTVKDGISSLYWKDGYLFLRYEKECIKFAFDETSHELTIVLVKNNKKDFLCWFGQKQPDWNDLVLSGGTEDLDYARYTTDNHFWFTNTPGMNYRTESLYYPKGTPLYITFRGARALVLSDHNRMELLDLEKGMCLQSIRCPDAYLAGFDQTGKNLFAVTENGHFSVYSIKETSQGKPYAVISDHETYKRKEIPSAFLKGIADMTEFCFAPIYKRSLPYSGNNNTKGNRYPAFTAFSVKNNWIAYYYYHMARSYIRIFQLDTMEFRAEYECDTIFIRDYCNQMIRHPFSVSEDGEKLILVSRDRQYELAVNQLAMQVKGNPLTNRAPSKTEDALVKDYYHRMNRWLPQIPKSIYWKQFSNVCLKLFVLLASTLVRSLTLPRLDEYNALHKRLQSPDIRFWNSQYWILDQLNGMVSVADTSGQWIAHHQFDFDVAAMTMEDGIVYAIDETTENLVSVKLK